MYLTSMRGAFQQAKPQPDVLNCGPFANESFRQRLVRQRLRSIRQRPKSLRQRPTGQFANVIYPVLTKKKKAAY